MLKLVSKFLPRSIMSSRPLLISQKEIEDILLNKDTFMFDCDGVLWRDNKEIFGAAKLIEHLRSMGKNIFFISNNNTKSRREYLEKFSRLGIKAEETEIYSSAYAAVYYIKHIAKVSGKVYVIGTSGMTEELDKEHILHTGVGPDVYVADWDSEDDLALDPEVACVLHGFDGHYSYRKMKKAANYLADQSVLFIATNKDFRVPSASDVIHPGSGCMIVATETAAQRNAIICGKPEAIIMECIVKEHNISPEKACVVGDNLLTDIAFGNRSGSSTILVLTGISTLADVEKEKNNPTKDSVKVPDYYIESVTKFYELIMSSRTE